MTDNNINVFIQRLQDICWNLKSDDPNVSYNQFLKKFLRIFNECFPLREINVRNKRKNKLWIDDELANMIRKKWGSYKKKY